MKTILENLLFEKNKKIYNNYTILKELLIFAGKYNNFIIDDKKFVEIINFYLDNGKTEFKRNDFLDELILFFIKIINYYEEGKFERFNFLLEKENLVPPLKAWLKENKENIFDILKYYYNDLLLEKREEIVFNNYFSITKISKDKSDDFFVPTINLEDMNIRILLKGKLFYKNGVFLKEGEYLITGHKFYLGKYKVLSDDFLMIMITLKKDFIERFNIKDVDGFIQVISTLHQDEFIKLLNKNIFKENFLFFLDIVTLILKGNNLLDNDIASVSEIFFKNELDICELIDTIDENITLPENEIKNILLAIFPLTEKKLEEFMYNSYKTTIKKYILKQKTKCIINDFNKFPLIGLENLLKKYNYSNMKNFRYNLKNFYNLSIKDL